MATRTGTLIRDDIYGNESVKRLNCLSTVCETPVLFLIGFRVESCESKALY